MQSAPAQDALTPCPPLAATQPLAAAITGPTPVTTAALAQPFATATIPPAPAPASTALPAAAAQARDTPAAVAPSTPTPAEAKGRVNEVHASAHCMPQFPIMHALLLLPLPPATRGECCACAAMLLAQQMRGRGYKPGAAKLEGGQPGWQGQRG